MPFVIWAGKKLYKWLKKKQGGKESELTEEETELKNIRDRIREYRRNVKRKLKQYGLSREWGTGIYVHLIDPEHEDLKVISKVANAFSPLFARLCLKLFGDPLKNEIGNRKLYILFLFFETYMFLRGVESEEDIIENPDLLKDFLKAAEEYVRTGKIRIGDVELPFWQLKKIVPPEDVPLPREITPEDISRSKDLLGKVYQKLLEIRQGGRAEIWPAAPPPEAVEELKRFVEEKLGDLPEEERKGALNSAEAWLAGLVGGEGTLGKTKEWVGALRSVTDEIARVHGSAVVASFLRVVGGLGLDVEEVRALGILSDPSTRVLGEALGSGLGVRVLALYLMGALSEEGLTRLWRENFPGTEIPEDVLRRLSEGRVGSASVVCGFQVGVVGEALRAVVRAGSSGELLGVLEEYGRVFEECAGRFAQLVIMSGKLLADRGFRGLLGSMGEELLGVAPQTVLRVLKLADAVGEVLRVHYPALRPIIANEDVLQQVLESAVREWWSRNADPAEAECVGRYASTLLSRILQRVGDVAPELVEEIQEEFLQHHLRESVNTLNRLSQELSEVRLSMLGKPTHLPSKKVEVLEAVLRTLRSTAQRNSVGV